MNHFLARCFSNTGIFVIHLFVRNDKSIMKFIFLLCISLLFPAVSNGQDKAETENLWKTLSKITYKKEYDEFLGFKIDKPVFADEVQALENTEVTVKGYIIPVEGYKSHKEFILSAYPYNMCFFCGGAGPETVMEVESLDAVEFTAEQIVLKGTLKLNADDINRLMYLLVDAQYVQSKS